MLYVNKKLNTCVHVYNFFLKIGSNLQSIFLFFMRITWGHQFFITGWGKLHNIDHVTQFFTSLNIPHPEFSAYLVGFCELIGGICLMLGFASRIITIPLIIIMFTAIGTAHSHIMQGSQLIVDPHVFVRQTPYPYLITSLLVFLFGPGRISIDAWIKRWVDNQPRY